MKRDVVLLFFVVLLALISIRSLFSQGFFPMHDDAQVARVIEMSRSLAHGQFPVRIVSDLGYGYGYPLFNFYGPLPYYVGSICTFLGFDPLFSTKFMIIVGILIGSISMYLLVRWIFGPLSGFLSSALFTYYPYRSVQLYVRGAIGELWAISFLPLVILGLLMLLKGVNKRKSISIIALSLSAVILSHTVFGYVFIALLLLVVVLSACITYINHRSIFMFTLPLLSACVLALALTAFFWLPALFEMRYTNVDKVIGQTANYKDHFVCLPQLWDSIWGYGGSVSGCIDGMSFKLGKIHIFLVIGSILLWIFSKKKDKWINNIELVVIILGGFFLVLTLPISQGMWNILPFTAFIQYPWRFLGPVGVFIAIIPGVIYYKHRGIFSILSVFVLIVLIIYVNLKIFVPQYLYIKPVSEYTTKTELRFRASRVSDEYLPKGIYIPKEDFEIVKERVSSNTMVTVKTIKETEVYGIYDLIVKKTGELKLNMAYFPGWHYYINGREIMPNIEAGQPSVVLSTDSNRLEMVFKDTPIRSIGNCISFISIIGIGIIHIYGEKIISYYRNTRLQRR